MRRFVSSIVLLVLASPFTEARAEPRVLERVKAEYLNALKVMETSFSQVRGSGHSRINVPGKTPDTDRIITGEFSLALDGVNQLGIKHVAAQTTAISTSRDEVACVNESYSFVLTRIDSSVPYLLNGHTSGRSDTTIEDIGRIFRDCLFASFSIENYPISSLITSPGFRFVDAETVVEDGRELVRIRFDSPDPKASVPAATVWVDPALGWILKRSEYYLHPSRKRLFRCSVDYSEPISGRLVPKHVVVLEPSNLRREFDFDSIRFEGSSTSAFHLPAFGLPELSDRPGVDLSRNRAGSWFIGLGVGSLCIAMLFRYFAGRNRD